MLAASFEIARSFDGKSQTFEFFESMAIELCGYLAHFEGLNIVAIEDSEKAGIRERFSALPLDIQAMKVRNFIKYYDHCVYLVNQGISLRDKKESLKAFSFIHGLRFPSVDEIFSVLGGGTYVEIYDRSFLQSYRSPDWLETTSHSLMKIETSDWRDLFFRSEAIAAAQMDLVQALFSGGITQPVYRPLRTHTVKERSSREPFCAELESLIYSPVYDLRGEFVGGLHALRLHELRRVSMRVCSDIISEDLSL